MKNGSMMLLALFATFLVSTPVLAAPADDAKADDAKADDAKADDAKADDAKADDAKADDAKADDAGETEGDKAEVKTDEDAAMTAAGLFKAIQQKHWGLALGLGLSLLVFGLRRMKVLAKVPAKALPWVTALLGVIGYVTAALMADDADLMSAAIGGASTGIAAVGLWEMVLKHFLSKK